MSNPQSPPDERGLPDLYELAECMPVLAPILRLHGHSDGYVTFSAGAGDEFHHRVAIRGDALETHFQETVGGCSKDLYVSINAGYRLSRFGPKGKAFGFPKHDSLNLRYLCACYVDIDCYAAAIDFGVAFAAMVNLQDDGVIPPASIIVRSGRGLWLLWLLRDPKNEDQPQRAWPEKIELYCRIQRAIGERLSLYEADLAARDAARHIRVPGSFHTGSEQFVKWWIQGAPNGAGYVYTLTELAEHFQVRPRTITARVRRASSESNSNRRRGWEALASRRLREFQKLLSLRGGGFDRGCRNNAALAYAWILRCNGFSRFVAYQELQRMSADCRPPLTPGEVKRAVKGGFDRKMRRVRDQTLSDWLRITPADSQLLEGLPPASCFPGYQEPTTDSASKGVEERRLAIAEIIAAMGGSIPTCRRDGQPIERTRF